MTTHELKTWPPYFRPVWDERKPFEIRYDDRAFQPGDVVVLREWDPHGHCDCAGRRHEAGACARYSGRAITATIGHLAASTPARGNQRGFNGSGYVVFALLDMVRNDGYVDELRRREEPVWLPAGPCCGFPPSQSPQDESAETSISAGDSSAPSLVDDGAAPRPRPAAPSPAHIGRRRDQAISRGGRVEHIPVTPPRLAFSSTSEDEQ